MPIHNSFKFINIHRLHLDDHANHPIEMLQQKYLLLFKSIKMLVEILNNKALNCLIIQQWIAQITSKKRRPT